MRNIIILLCLIFSFNTFTFCAAAASQEERLKSLLDTCNQKRETAVKAIVSFDGFYDRGRSLKDAENIRKWLAEMSIRLQSISRDVTSGEKTCSKLPKDFKGSKRNQFELSMRLETIKDICKADYTETNRAIAAYTKRVGELQELFDAANKKGKVNLFPKQLFDFTLKHAAHESWRIPLPFGKRNQVSFDAKGNIYIVSWSDLMKLNGKGKLLWKLSDTKMEFVETFTVDEHGNSYLLGGVNISEKKGVWNPANNRISITAIDTNGNVYWNIREPIKSGRPKAITLDQNKNIYVSGTYKRHNKGKLITDERILLLKYDQSGIKQLVVKGDVEKQKGRFAIPDKRLDGQMCVSPLGQIYATFSEFLGAGRVLACFDNQGSLKWILHCNEFQGTILGPNQMLIDDAGSFYLGGKSNDGQAVIIKVNKNGQRVWTKEVGGPIIGLGGLERDSIGNLYVTWNRLPSRNKAVICKLNEVDGNISWCKDVYFNSDAYSPGVVSAMAIDVEGYVNLIINLYNIDRSVRAAIILYQIK